MIFVDSFLDCIAVRKRLKLSFSNIEQTIGHIAFGASLGSLRTTNVPVRNLL